MENIVKVSEVVSHFGHSLSLKSLLHLESESGSLLVTRSNDNHSPGPMMREVSPLIREVNLATESSAPSAAGVTKCMHRTASYRTR